MTSVDSCAVPLKGGYSFLLFQQATTSHSHCVHLFNNLGAHKFLNYSFHTGYGPCTVCEKTHTDRLFFLSCCGVQVNYWCEIPLCHVFVRYQSSSLVSSAEQGFTLSCDASQILFLHYLIILSLSSPISKWWAPLPIGKGDPKWWRKNIMNVFHRSLFLLQASALCSNFTVVPYSHTHN